MNVQHRFRPRSMVTLVCALSLLNPSGAGAQAPQIFTIDAGQRKQIWLGVLTLGSVYLRINNASGNCAKFYWKYGPFKRSVGTLCNDASLKNFSPLAALWIDRPETTTAVALSDDVTALDLTPLCKVGVPCPFKP